MAQEGGAIMSSARKRIRFEIKCDPGSKVSIAGTFNNWDPAKNRLKETGPGKFSSSILLHPGIHEYKFVINGIWTIDPNCPDWAPNGMGSLNSVLRIG